MATATDRLRRASLESATIAGGARDVLGDGAPPPAAAVRDHPTARPAFDWRPYVRIARPDHWFKNVFMLPGVLLAVILLPAESLTLTLACSLALGIASTCLVASANYAINEYLDAEFDRHHPKKKNRPCVSGAIRGRYLFLEYTLLAALGLGLASLVGLQFLLLSALLTLMGILYNVRPFRTKDRQYLDVISESFNNPLRLLLGWSIVLGNALPPSSILITYWSGGAFLMGIKRYAEYRSIDDPTLAGRYRRSFRYYTERTLLLSSFFYALLSAFFLGIFLVKYRIEFLLSAPLFALLFTWYLHIGMQVESLAQTPEKLFRQRKFMAFTISLALVVIALFVIDIPWLGLLLEQSVYHLP